jgi:RNA polymerase sigma-70 factor (ECF subfamily)
MLTSTDIHRQRCEIRDFESLYQAWFREVYRWILMLGGPHIDAEDLTQEVFIVVQRKLGRFDGANLAGWLFRIAQRTVRDHRRGTWFRNIFLRPRDVALDDVASAAAGPDVCLVRKEHEICLYELVSQLNPKWRDSFLLFEVGGLSGEEIARLQGIPHATVRTYLFRARREMLTIVRKHESKGTP